MEEVIIFVSVVRANNAVTTLTRIRTIPTRIWGDLKASIKDFILEFKDERKWVGGYFEHISINPVGDVRNHVFKFEEKDKLMAEFNELLK